MARSAPRAVAGPRRLAWARRVGIGLGTLVGLVAIIGVDYLPPRLDLQPGQPSPRDIRAPRTVEFEDDVRTEALRAEAMRAVPPVLRHVPTEVAAARQAVARAFAAVLDVRARSRFASVVAGMAAMRAAAALPLSDVAARAAATAPRTQLARAAKVAEAAVDQALAAGVRVEDLTMARERARQAVRDGGLPVDLRALAAEVAAAAVRPTMEVDQGRTAAARLAAASAVPPVRVRLERGQIIVRDGDVVTPAHLRMLAAAGLYPPRVSWAGVGGVAVVAALVLVATGAYLWQYQPEIWTSERLLVVWSLIVLLTVFLSQALGAPRFSNFLAPSAMGAMLLGILLRRRLALFSSATVAVLVGLASQRDLASAVVAFLGGLAGVFATRQIHRRSDFGLAGLVVGATNAVAILGMGLAEGLEVYPALVVASAWGVAGGLLSGVAAIGVLPFIEQLFGLVTPIKLLELGNPAHPLLRRLQLEAPGTYHHSIMVSNLAEAAAEAVGADALLARIGTYYHDVGKLRRPAFFVENQMGVDNPHEKMTPSLSALTVAAHVRDGLDLAREYGLPPVIQEFIAQHHGTTRLTYFYHQALERGDAVDEAAFRYEGPRPQTPETAILMLADAAEAAVRSLPRPTPDRLEEAVRKIIREKLEDGQLDECGLTFRDLDRIAGAFVRILSGILHPRVEYPDLERELQRRRPERVARLRWR
ncbi:MAG: HDIG domain-containing protein [Armatimonadota bacterium]|nr:HDIG domain-containing protein [Armatimonadota bacterium]MDR7533320.1 HDIG domain-containing protein [Armatimonadota bacterium]MDR7536561.1 HDIG domain-containing protein [Armatimonadota bacterium]